MGSGLGDHRSHTKLLLNAMPGVYLSLLGLGEGGDAQFTVGIVHPILPCWRQYFGLFLA